MHGLLADVNVQGHLPYLRGLMEGQGLLEIRTEMGISLVNFPDLGLDRATDDRTLWHFCQENGWVLFTDNRSREDENSLTATIQDSWHEGHLPVLTLANKGKFENSATYATRVAQDVAEVLVLVFVDEIRNQPRIFVPL
ncbi:MAG: hypothetical protein JO112_14190 [Planctomycetes bacterium]|nr:hypothetical protein [Planctomycetota bacterium]